MKKSLFVILFSLLTLGNNGYAGFDTTVPLYINEKPSTSNTFLYYHLNKEEVPSIPVGEALAFNPVAQYKNFVITFDQVESTAKPVETSKPDTPPSPASFIFDAVHTDFFLKATDVNRSRLGMKFSFNPWKGITPYTGLAWEQEYTRENAVTGKNSHSQSPAFEEATGVGEIGFSWKSTNIDNLSLDLGLQGYLGKREGIGSQLQFKMIF